MSRDAVAAGGAPVAELRVDGGACVNDLLMQFQADLLGIPVVRPKVIETTALGAAYLAGLASGVYRGLDELAAQWQVERRFHADDAARARRRADGALGARGAAGHGLTCRADAALRRRFAALSYRPHAAGGTVSSPRRSCRGIEENPPCIRA